MNINGIWEEETLVVELRKAYKILDGILNGKDYLGVNERVILLCI
jgi:hypothetical protein